MNVELVADLRERCSRLELLYQVSSVIHSTLDAQEALHLIIREAVKLTNASSGSVVLMNPTNNLLEIEASHGLPIEAKTLKLRLGQGITGWVAKTGQAACVGNVADDTRYVEVKAKVRSELAVPLLVQEEVRGVLNVDSNRIRAFNRSDQELLEAFAEQAARVIQNTWLYEQIRFKAKMFEGLTNVSRTINSTLSLEEALKAIAQECAALMSGKVCALHLVDPSHTGLELKACYGGGAAYLRKRRLGMDDSLLGIVIRRRKPIQLENVQKSNRYQNQAVAASENLVALLSVPLLFSGEAIGTLSLYKGHPYVFSNEEIRVLSSLAELSAIAIEKARLYERIVVAEDQLRQNERLSALGLLAAEVAHEIRNPLTVIKMLFHSLDLSFAPEDPRAKDTAVISAKMDHLNRIVERILSFARNAEPKFGSVDLNQIISELVLITRHKLKAHQVTLHCDLDEALPMIQGDSTQIEQAFLNLILNSLDAMPNGGNLTITTHRAVGRKGRSMTDSVEISFVDTGEGMSEAQCARAFSSLLSTTKRGGTGLGLAIVQKVIETHRGQLKIRSKLKKGTRISVVIPLQREGHFNA